MLFKFTWNAMSDPADVPPYQLQSLISQVHGTSPTSKVLCSQALGTEIYVGCSNGQLLRFALQADRPDLPEAYTLLSQQNLSPNKPISEIVLIPCISRALILSDSQLHIFTLPSLDPAGISPIRNVLCFAVDEQHLTRLPSTEPLTRLNAVDFCVIKRNSIGLFALREKLQFQKEIPFPNAGTVAKRTGPLLCVPDQEFYNVINLVDASALPLIPVLQTPDTHSGPIKPLILVISNDDFLIVSNIDGRGMGIFITGSGDPVRGTLEWPIYPQSICLDFPYVAALLPNKTIEIHNIETQMIAQVVPASEESNGLSANVHSYLVPSTQRSDKLRSVPVPLLRSAA